MNQHKRLARDKEANQTQSLLPPYSSLDDPIPPPISAPSIPNESLPIELKNGKYGYTHYPLTHYVSFDNLSPTFPCFAYTLSSMSILSLIKKI